MLKFVSGLCTEKYKTALSVLLLLGLVGFPASAQIGPSRENQLRQELQSAPKNAEAYQKLAEYLLQDLRRDWGRRDPNAQGPDFIKQSDGFQRRAQELIQLYSRCLELKPNSISARVDLAEVYFVFQGRMDEAERLLNESLAEQPDNPKAIIAMSEFQFFVKNETKLALERLEEALLKHPLHSDLSITLADLLTGSSGQSKDFERARDLLNEALAPRPKDRAVRYMLASVWYREALLPQAGLDPVKADQALTIFTQLLQEEGDADWSREAARIARSLKRLPQARELVRQGLKQDPVNVDLYLLMGDLWLEQGAVVLDTGVVPPEAFEAEKYYLWILDHDKTRDLIASERVQLFYNLGLLGYYKGKAMPVDQGQKAIVMLKESEAFYARAIAIFDAINIINGPLQQDLARTLEAMAERQVQAQNKSEAVANYRRACGLKLESSCEWLKTQGLGL